MTYCMYYSRVCLELCCQWKGLLNPCTACDAVMVASRLYHIRPARSWQRCRLEHAVSNVSQQGTHKAPAIPALLALVLHSSTCRSEDDDDDDVCVFRKMMGGALSKWRSLCWCCACRQASQYHHPPQRQLWAAPPWLLLTLAAPPQVAVPDIPPPQNCSQWLISLVVVAECIRAPCDELCL